MGDEAARAGDHAHAFHQRIVADVLTRAGRYRHRTRQTLDLFGSERSREIRARIAENARKRAAIAEAMKAEAGVHGHDLTGERDGGLAWTDRARILAPAGENRVQLATLAHECGHVFLHGAGTPGNVLPGHVKEMEAESYAHQAFRAHGMRMPKQVTAWGRHYVGQWVANDRAAGIAIDLRAEAYALGQRSPYEPLRAIPPTWRAAGLVGEPELLRQAILSRLGSDLRTDQLERVAEHVAEFRIANPQHGTMTALVDHALADLARRIPRAPAAAVADPANASVTVSVRRHEKQEPGHNAGRWARAWGAGKQRRLFIREAAELVRHAGSCVLHGSMVGWLVVYLGGHFAGCPDPWCAPTPDDATWRHGMTALAVGLVWANLAVLWQTVRRR